MRHMIIDTDTASDDAVAIIMALQWPDVIVDAITVVSGNVALAQAGINARYAVELCGVTVPVYAGCAKPLLREVAHAEWFHGADGFGEMNYPPPKREMQPDHAVTELIRRFRAAPQEIILVTLGPLTNIASALLLEPSLAQWVKHCYVMGGAACVVGNVTAAAEYNIWCDPESAEIVFQSGMPITMIGWEHSRGAATLDDDEMAMVRNFGTVRAQFAIDSNRHALQALRNIQGEAGLALADPVAMIVALDPDVVLQRSMHHVAISCDHELTRGMTVVDQLHVSGNPPNVDVVWQLDPARWKAALYRCLR
ncbi:MAG TPA: nucleoside hydrolase [Anaerolineae bacterium]|nr:nucleoside hydrolase [Anaerolineae bacterium]